MEGRKENNTSNRSSEETISMKCLWNIFILSAPLHKVFWSFMNMTSKRYDMVQLKNSLLSCLLVLAGEVQLFYYLIIYWAYIDREGSVLNLYGVWRWRGYSTCYHRSLCVEVGLRHPGVINCRRNRRDGKQDRAVRGLKRLKHWPRTGMPARALW